MSFAIFYAKMCVVKVQSIQIVLTSTYVAIPYAAKLLSWKTFVVRMQTAIHGKPQVFESFAIYGILYPTSSDPSLINVKFIKFALRTTIFCCFCE